MLASFVLVSLALFFVGTARSVPDLATAPQNVSMDTIVLLVSESFDSSQLSSNVLVGGRSQSIQTEPDPVDSQAFPNQIQHSDQSPPQSHHHWFDRLQLHDESGATLLAIHQTHNDDFSVFDRHELVRHVEQVSWSYEFENVPRSHFWPETRSTCARSWDFIAFQSTIRNTLTCRNETVASVFALIFKEESSCCLNPCNVCFVLHAKMLLFLKDKDKVEEAKAVLQEMYESHMFAATVWFGRLPYLGKASFETMDVTNKFYGMLDKLFLLVGLLLGLLLGLVLSALFRLFF